MDKRITTKWQYFTRRRNWGIYILRGVQGQLRYLKPLMSEPDYNRLENAVTWAIMDLQAGYGRDRDAL